MAEFRVFHAHSMNNSMRGGGRVIEFYKRLISWQINVFSVNSNVCPVGRTKKASKKSKDSAEKNQ